MIGFHCKSHYSCCVYCQVNIILINWHLSNSSELLPSGWWILMQTAMSLLSKILSSGPVCNKSGFIYCIYPAITPVPCGVLTLSLWSTSWPKNGNMVNIKEILTSASNKRAEGCLGLGLSYRSCLIIICSILVSPSCV